MLPEAMRNRPVPQVARHDLPVWQGPQSDGPQGGITQGLLQRYLTCKERFRLLVIEGWKDAGRFSHRLEYGNMWHLCEEVHLEQRGEFTACWEDELERHARKLLQDFPYQRGEVEKWWAVCRIQFPIYLEHWQRHHDAVERKPLLREEVFHVPHRLPSGRAVWLRGKWDGIDLVNGGIVLREHKTKGDIDEGQIKRQLRGDLQTMFYLKALQVWQSQDDYGKPIRTPKLVDSPITGILYNVVRRPLSGGKGSIVQRQATKGAKCGKCKGIGQAPVMGRGRVVIGHLTCPKCGGAGRCGAKPAETTDEYLARLAKVINDKSEDFFMRWDVGVNSADIARFSHETLVPVLENLCDDWEWWSWCKGENRNPYDWPERTAIFVSGRVGALKGPAHFPRHFRMPFGVRSPLLDGGGSDLDELLESGSTTGLRQTDDLFPELKEAN